MGNSIILYKSQILLFVKQSRGALLFKTKWYGLLILLSVGNFLLSAK